MSGVLQNGSLTIDLAKPDTSNVRLCTECKASVPKGHMTASTIQSVVLFACWSGSRLIQWTHSGSADLQCKQSACCPARLLQSNATSGPPLSNVGLAWLCMLCLLATEGLMLCMLCLLSREGLTLCMLCRDAHRICGLGAAGCMPGGSLPSKTSNRKSSSSSMSGR